MSPTEEPPMTPTRPLTMSDVAALLRLTLTQPAAAARAVLEMGIPREHHWTLFLLAITLTGAVWELMVITGAAQGSEGAEPFSGITAAAISGGSILSLSAAILWIGRLAGGEGDMGGILVLMIWYQFVQLAFLALDLVLVLILPAMAALFSLLAAGVALWILTSFIATAHGFRSLGRVFLGMVLAIFALAFVLSLLLTPFVGATAGA